MALQLLLPSLLVLGAPRAEEPAHTPTTPIVTPSLRRASGTLNARREPSAKAPLRGLIQKGNSFLVIEVVAAEDCEGGWGRLGPDAWACLSATEPTDDPPVQLPLMVDFPPPTLEESATYAKTGQYTGVVGEAPLLPYIYGKRGRRGRAPIYASAEAYAAGARPIGEAESDRALVFTGAQQTERGEVLLRPDGGVVPSSSVWLYPIDRFQGRDLVAAPMPESSLPGWATVTDGLPVYAAPRREGEPALTLPYHAPLELLVALTVPDGSWWAVADALGPGVPGYVEDRGGLRHATVVPPPQDVGEALWLDVDLDEQVLMAWQGGRMVYATLVSTGKPGDATPPGLYRIGDKSVAWDMASRPDASEPYLVERVPWVMHFAPRYALHGVFWHAGFGRTRSHGCVNLAPRDARWVFEHVAPRLPQSWTLVYESPLEPGTTLRVREGSEPVQDRRRPIR